MTTQTVQWWRTAFGEQEARSIADAIAHEHVSMGPITERFEKAFAESMQVPFAVATTSGSVAILMALKAVGVGYGDEVIIPNRTFIAPAHAALMLGARVVLVDVVEDAPVMDASEIGGKIGPRTKAIVPVHLNGRAVDMGAIRQVATENGLAIVEDACQAMFSSSAAGLLGTHSDAGCFSLGVAKLISTGQGGVIVTRTPELYEHLRLLRTHGVADTFAARYSQIGLNFRFTDMLASMGLVQLGRLQERIASVNAIYARYSEGLRDVRSVRMIPVNVRAGEVPLYVEVLCEKRDELIRFLDARHIQARPFHPSLNVSPHLGSRGRFPNSERFASQGLFLPCGPAQPLQNIDRVIATICEFDSKHAS